MLFNAVQGVFYTYVMAVTISVFCISNAYQFKKSSYFKWSLLNKRKAQFKIDCILWKVFSSAMTIGWLRHKDFCLICSPSAARHTFRITFLLEVYRNYRINDMIIPCQIITHNFLPHVVRFSLKLSYSNFLCSYWRNTFLIFKLIEKKIETLSKQHSSDTSTSHKLDARRARASKLRGVSF